MAGMRISLSETMDAVKALQYVNLLEREEVRTALSACLAKSEEDKRILSETFEHYFIPVRVKTEWLEAEISELERKKAEVNEQAEKLQFQGEALELSNGQKEIYTALPGSEKQSILDFLDKTSSGKNVKSNFKPIVETMIKGKLDKLAQERREEWALYGGVLDAVPSEAGIISAAVTDEVRKEQNLLHKNIGQINDKDIPRVIQLIRQLTVKMRRELQRRLKSTARKDRLDIKKTISSSLSTGGTMFRLAYKSRRNRKTRFILLCDVSASMYRFSGFVLQFTAGMQTGSTISAGYLFSQHGERINLNDTVNAEEFEKRVRESSVWGKGTNIGNVLEELLVDRSSQLNSSAVVILVSDAKTLEQDRTVNNLIKLSRRVKRILWLNPLPERDWDKIPSIGRFREWCSMLDCSTLEKLSAACKSL